MSRSKSDGISNVPFTFPLHQSEQDGPDLGQDRAELELHFEPSSNSSHGSVPIVGLMFRHVDRVFSIEPTSSSKDVAASLVLSIVPPKFSKRWNSLLSKVTYNIPFVPSAGKYQTSNFDLSVREGITRKPRQTIYFLIDIPRSFI